MSRGRNFKYASGVIRRAGPGNLAFDHNVDREEAPYY